MTRLEAHLAAEVIAAQLLDEQPDADKLRFLRERTAEVLTFIDAEIEKERQRADREIVRLGSRCSIQRGVLVAMLERQPAEFWANKWNVSRDAIIRAVTDA